MSVVEVKDLEKAYTQSSVLPWRSGSQTEALNGVSFSVESGEIFGIVGPNGAGKTTLINILSGLLYRDAGVADVFGMDVQVEREAVAERMNVATAYSEMSSRLTVGENLRVFGRIYDVDEVEQRIDAVLNLFEIGDMRDRQVRHLSAGQKTRANLAKAFINRPELLLLDEATAGLDPHIAVKTRDAIRSANEEHGTTIIITSHNMTDIDELSDRMLFLHEGEVLRTGTPADLKQDIHVKVLTVEVDAATDEFRDVVAQFGGDITDVTARIAIEDEADILTVLERVGALDVVVTDIEVTSPDLDQLFAEVAAR